MVDSLIHKELFWFIENSNANHLINYFCWLFTTVCISSVKVQSNYILNVYLKKQEREMFCWTDIIF